MTAKLPPEFVKAPDPAPSRPKRVRKNLVLEAPRDPNALLLRLTDGEMQALEHARQQYQITIEQMLHRVLAEWMAPKPAPPQSAPERPLRERLQLLVTTLRTWRAFARGFARR
jgi:hypothetical protein